MGMMQNSNNPMGLIQNMFGSNPVFQKVMQMAQGKSPEEIQQIVRNIASQQGMNEQQSGQFISQFGLKL
jgi:hypothetical protein